jgi:NADH-quinone oxidoreductase subunit N
VNYAALFQALVPEIVIVATAFGVLAVDLLLVREKSNATRSAIASFLACAGCALAIFWLAQNSVVEKGGLLALTALTQFLKIILLALTVFTVLISFHAPFTRHVGEFFALLLLAATGLMLLISSDNLLMIFVALELLGICFYTLTAFRKASVESAEASLKYFFFGGMAAAFSLFGISLLYGVTGEIQLGAIARQLEHLRLEPVFYVALVMTLTGLGFKIAAAPFHLWAPDAYQGAPTPIASFIASGSKVGSFFVLARILFEGFGAQSGSAAFGKFAPGWMSLMAVLAVASMVIGNLAAIVQTSVKRLLAYSAVAHAGYALLGFFGSGPRAVSSLMFYVVTYAATVLGAFAVVAALENSGSRDRFTDFCGLSRRSPLLAGCMLVFLLSLAGIPPLSGFFGKFYLFTSAAGGAADLGMLWLVVLAVGAGVVSLYYYLQILKQIYVVESPDSAGSIELAVPARLAIVALAIVVIALGCAPHLLLDKLNAALQIAAF